MYKKKEVKIIYIGGSSDVNEIKLNKVFHCGRDTLLSNSTTNLYITYLRYDIKKKPCHMFYPDIK